MKFYLSLLFLIPLVNSFSQDTTLICNDLPFANPTIKSVCLQEDVNGFFKSILPEKLKKGNHSALFKVYVNCHGKTENTFYQKGNLTKLDQDFLTSEIQKLQWKPAQHENKSVTSVVFISFEIVNGQISVSIR